MKDKWDIPDEEFDGLFREASEKLKPPYDPEAWRKMQAKLDEASPPSKGPRDNKFLTRSLLMILLLLLVSVGYWVYDAVNHPISREGVAGVQLQQRPKTSLLPNTPSHKNSAEPSANAPLASNQGANKANRELKKEDERTVNQPVDADKSPFKQPENAEPISSNKALVSGDKTASKTGEIEKADNKVEPSKSSNSTNRKADSSTKATHQPNATELSAIPNKISQNKNERKDKTVILLNKQLGQEGTRNTASEPLLPVIEPERRVNREKQKSLNKRNKYLVNDTEQLDNKADKAPFLTNEPIQDAAQERWFSNSLKQLESKALKTSVTFSMPLVMAVARAVAELPVKPVVITRPKFGVRVVMAPDVNRVGSSNPFAMGDSYGILLEYQFINRLRVQVGAMRTVKKYVSGPGDYSNPTGFWTYGVKPATIEADCKILDLPLNIRWDAVRRPRYDLFINSGLSSYLMLNERYNYKYAPPNDTNTHLRQSWEKSRGSNHFFSTLNLSMGYERQLRKGFTVQIEPYLKLPVKGVGFAAVDIYSTGLLISGKYQFGWKK